MQPERWRQIDQLFHLALEQEPGQRSVFLAQACAGDQALQSEVEELISSHELAESFIETPASDLAAELLSNDQPGVKIGEVIGPYQILSVLGIGGMGEVYLAQDSRLGREVALKLLPPQFTIDAERVRRFEQEARAASALNHPNIVTIHEIGRIDNAQFIVTEFVDGRTLRQLMSEKRLSLHESLDAAVQAASALEAAHAAGIVHRDIKPENIMMRRDRILKVLDFGLAKLTERKKFVSNPEESTRTLVKTNPGTVMGTVQYMSPEQARAKEVDARTDIWSLGVVLYEMVARLAPFDGETPSHVIVSVLETEPSPLARYSEVPAELERIVTKTLRKNREERYQTASDLVLDLKNLKQELEVEARLKRSLDPEKFGAPPSGGAVFTSHSQPSEGRTPNTHLTMPRPTSSAEYLVGEIRKHRRVAVFGLAALLLVVTGAVFLWTVNKSTPAAPNAALKSIAVLPLKSINNDATDDYLGFGIADTIITRLSQLREVTVRPTSAVRKYADRNIEVLEAGRQLKADAVLDGTLQRVGNRLRVNLNLLRVRDGQSLWSESLNVSSTDILSVQDQVSQRVAERLRLTLTPQDPKSRSANPDAYDDYLRGKFYLYRGGKTENDTAIEMLERAVRKDPNFAAAYAALAQAYRVKFYFFASHENQWEEKAFVAIEKALSADPELAEAYVARGVLLWTQSHGFPHERAIQEYRRALELNSNLDEARRQLAVVYNHIGLLDEALAEAQKAADINPGYVQGVPLSGAFLYQGKYNEAVAALTASKDSNSPIWVYQMASSLLHLGRRDEASAIIEESLRKNPEDQGGVLYSMRALLFALAGDERRAEENIKTALEKGKEFGHFHHATYTVAAAYAIMNKREQALKWIQFTADTGFPCYPLFEHDPDLNNLRQDPRFIAFMSKLKQQWEHYRDFL